MFLEFSHFLSSGTGHDTLLLTSKGHTSHSFIVAHLLANAARNKKRTWLICSGESRQFYSMVSQRAGVSLQQLETSGHLRCTCLVTEWKRHIRHILNNKDDATQQQQHTDWSKALLATIKATSRGTNDTSKTITPTSDEISKQQQSSFEPSYDLIIIDDLMPLVDLGLSTATILRMVLDLKESLRTRSACSSSGEFVGGVSNSNSTNNATTTMLAVGVRIDDPHGARLAALVKTACTLWTNVHPLATGYSKDVHGVIEMGSVTAGDTFGVSAANDRHGRSNQRSMHYKVTERGAKLLVVGGHHVASVS